MTRAIMVAFHKYQPYGDKFYQPLFDYFIHNLSTLCIDEYDKLYILDSTWNFTPDDLLKIIEAKGEVINVDKHLRYYDAYKSVLPQIKEDLVMFMDDDMVIYQKGIINKAFNYIDEISPYDIVSIYDTIGTYKTGKLNGKNKFCPYFFATPTMLLKKYLDIDWAPHMPHSETLGLLTEAMLNDGLRPYEFLEDKSNILFDGTTQDDQDHKEGGRGYYHIRSGSVPALLLAYKYNDAPKYYDYIQHQPKNEILRQIAWYNIMIAGSLNHAVVMHDLLNVLEDFKITPQEWMGYMHKFMDYHGL